MKVNEIDPFQDGKTHINIYSGSMTDLGRKLSNFAEIPIGTSFGEFASIEAFWYWLGIDDECLQKPILMGKSGYEAKKVGKQLRELFPKDDPHFKAKVCFALWLKVLQHQDLYDELKASTLPFYHYYLINGKVVEKPEHYWLVEAWEFIRYIIQLKGQSAAS